MRLRLHLQRLNFSRGKVCWIVKKVDWVNTVGFVAPERGILFAIDSHSMLIL
jgi:hypothetical protein